LLSNIGQGGKNNGETARPVTLLLAGGDDWPVSQQGQMALQ
jgi:hypothetical protein